MAVDLSAAVAFFDVTVNWRNISVEIPKIGQVKSNSPIALVNNVSCSLFRFLLKHSAEKSSLLVISLLLGYIEPRAWSE